MHSDEQNDDGAGGFVDDNVNGNNVGILGRRAATAPADRVALQIFLSQYGAYLPLPKFWSSRRGGYGWYGNGAGNDFHNNLPSGAYKIEDDFDN